MVAVGILIASVVLLTGWMAYRRFAMDPGAWASGASRLQIGIRLAARMAAPNPVHDAGKIERANAIVADRLWRLAFGAGAQIEPPARAQARVRELICAKLQVDALDPDYFPRRPSLMPQLLKALDDPHAESDKLSRIIAHDPVLTADVLRLANSSLYRMSPAPVETIQRAIVVCGVDALRGIVATAMLRPVFRASRTNFPRLPRMLWDRTERAARAAELYAAKMHPQDRFEAQLVVLLNALGPLVVYGTTLDAYAGIPHLAPDAQLCVELIGTLGPDMSLRIARDWQTSPRLLAALGKSPEETLTSALFAGELFGTLSFLESQTVISADERLDLLKSAGLSDEVADSIWLRLAGHP